MRLGPPARWPGPGSLERGTRADSARGRQIERESPLTSGHSLRERRDCPRCADQERRERRELGSSPSNASSSSSAPSWARDRCGAGCSTSCRPSRGDTPGDSSPGAGCARPEGFRSAHSSTACVSSSIQCRSSTTTQTGCSWLSRSRSRLSASWVSRRRSRGSGSPSPVLDMDVEQREERRQQRPQRFVQREEPAGHFFTYVAVLVPVLNAKVALEETDDRQVRRSPFRRRPSRTPPEPAVCPVRMDELVEESGLAHARLTDDRDHLTVPSGRLVEGAS